MAGGRFSRKVNSNKLKGQILDVPCSSLLRLTVYSWNFKGVSFSRPHQLNFLIESFYQPWASALRGFFQSFQRKLVLLRYEMARTHVIGQSARILQAEINIARSRNKQHSQSWFCAKAERSPTSCCPAFSG